MKLKENKKSKIFASWGHVSMKAADFSEPHIFSCFSRRKLQDFGLREEKKKLIAENNRNGMRSIC